MKKSSKAPPSTPSSSSSVPRRRSMTLLLKWCMLSFIVVLLFLLSHSYRTVHDTNMHDTIPSNTKTQTSGGISDSSRSGSSGLSSLVHVQRLLDETNALIKELGIGTSSSLKKDSASRNDSTTIDSGIGTSINPNDRSMSLIPLQTELLSVHSSLAHTEDTLTRCVAERHEKEVDLDRCQTAMLKCSQHEDQHAAKGSTTSSIISSLLKSNTGDSHDAIGSGRKWLVMGIPTVPRVHGEKYLLQTLDSISKELPDDPLNLLYGKILIYVVNVHGAQHAVFDEASALYLSSAKAMYFRFATLEAGELLADPIPGRNELNDLGNANHPGYKVRKQTRNLASVIKKTAGTADTYLFLEDDMQFCPHGFTTIQYLLDKASRYHPNWLAIRASYGMNGVFMRSADALVFADYMLKHQSRRPPDHLVVEWYAGETVESAEYKSSRKNIGFRYNLFSHMGSSSTLRHEAAAPMPLCYEQLMEPVVFKVEAFDPMACPLDDLWPCQTEHVTQNGHSHLNFQSLRK